jgi:pimeloyl-ACP methyl ester carboxylesterase
LEDHFWADLRAKLEARGYEVVPVAWDWRLTPDQAQEEFLARAIEREAIKSGQPVDVVAHSMGGLVSLAFLSSQASNSRLSGYLDRLVMIGTPVAGSVSAYGLMEVADPLGLSDSLSRSVGKGPVYLGSDHVYSAIAGYLWNVQTGGRESLYECTSRSDTTCNFEIYTRGVTQEQRRTALTAQAPGGWFLYPNRQHLPFAATLPAPSSHLPSTATAFFQKSDSPNSFNSAALNAECRYDPTAATTITANHKTNVNLLLSQDVTTISTVGTKKSNLSGRALSINETTVKDWSEIQRYDDGGDGTVPVRGQLDALATFLGTTKASLLNDSNSNRNNPCATIGGFGEHGDLPTVVNVHSWVLRRLPYPGVAVANAPREEVAKVASPPVPQLMIATEGVVDFVVRDPALVAVGRTRLSAAPFEAASGQTSAVTRTDGNRVQISIDNPTVGSTSVQLTGTSQEKITVQGFSALYADTVGQVSTASIRAMIRPGIPVNAWVAVQSTATSLPIGIDGPAAPTNIRTTPGATATAISWLAPSNSAVPVVGYRIYASPTQDDGWTLVGTTAANAFSYRAPYPAASNVQREISFVVVAVDAQDRLSRVPEFTSNRVIDHIEGNFVSVRGTPGATVTSAAITLPNNVPVTVSVSGGQMSVNGGAWGTTPLAINPGDTVALRGVTPATRGAQQDVVLTTGTSSTVFSVLGTPLPFCVRPTRPVADAGTFVRYLKLVTGLPLLQGLYPAAEVTTTNASTLEAHYRDNITAYDFNGDNATNVLIDGLLYARYALGFRGAELVAGIAVGTTRTTAQIETALAACQ